jgi:hypothetical protein
MVVFCPCCRFSSCGGKFAIIDGQHRTTAALLVGLETVPCQVVVAARHEQAAAFKAINGITTPISRMALHAAGLVAGEDGAKEIADVCLRADVENTALRNSCRKTVSRTKRWQLARLQVV